MFELPRRDQHQFGRAIVGGKPRLQVVDGDSADRRLASEHGPAKRLFGKSGFLQMVENDVRWRVARLGQFLHDDLLLELEVPGLEMRPADEVGQQVHSKRKVRRKQGRVEGGQLAVGRGVEIAADILDRLADLSCRAAARALEHHMLEQMRDAVERRRLIARAGRRIEPDGHGLDALHRPAGDAKPVG